MNTEQQEQATIALLNAQKNIQPSQALLRSTLHKLPSGKQIKSPYLSLLQKFSIATIAIIVIGTGGIFYSQYHAAQAPGQSTGNESAVISSNTSNMALNQDMNTIDAQLSGLDSDNANTDEALQHSTQ